VKREGTLCALSATRDDQAGKVLLRFRGQLTFGELGGFYKDVRRYLTRQRASLVTLELGEVGEADGGSLALLVQLTTELEGDGIPTVIAGATGRVKELLELYRSGTAPATKRLHQPGLLERTGLVTIELWHEVKAVLGFTGTFVMSAFGVIWRPNTGNWRDVMPNMERAGADGLPIVLLINFLVGLVIAFQGAVQLKQFGANIYVADLVSISICRELGPLMTAIIVCGRSGAAFAAELGTMKVNEEIDALRTMGFDPVRFLVFPRALALVMVLPLLTLLADAIAIAGGGIVGLVGLDLTLHAYVIRTQQALNMVHVFSGVFKSFAFGLVIALIACQQGLSASGGAQGVGQRTTSSVVAILFSLILVNAMFTVLMTIFDL